MKKKNSIRALLILVIAGIILKLAFLFAYKIMRVDLFYYIEFARTMLDGGVMYKDFGCSHPPLGYFEFFWMAKIFGYGNMYVAIKIVAIAVQSMTAYFVYLIFSERSDHRRGLAAALFFLVLISLNVNFWPHNIPFTCLLPVFAGLYFMARDDYRPSRWQLFCAGICFACSTLISTNMVVYTLLVPALSVKNRWRDIPAIFSDCVAAFIGFSIPFAAFFVYFALHGALGDWYHWNIVWASIYGGFKPLYMNIVLLFWGMIQTWQILPFCVAGFYVVYRIIRDRAYVESRHAFFTLAVFIAALTAKAIMNKAVPRYYMYMFPGIVFTAYYAVGLLKGRTRKVVSIVIPIFVVVCLTFTSIGAWKNRSFYPERANLRGWIHQNIPHNSTIWVWDEGYEIYYESKLKRAHISFFAPGSWLDKSTLWQGIGYRGTAEQWGRFDREIRRDPPDYIIDITLGFEQVGDSRFTPRAGIHKQCYDAFVRYTDAEYRVVKIIDGRYRILRRRETGDEKHPVDIDRK